MKKVGNYLLVSKLGEGQFGTVYKASHQETNEEFAVKTVAKAKINSNPKLKTLFDTEMAVMSRIKHPNVLHLHEYLETGNNYYLVLDYCNSGDLEHHVKKNTNLGEQESIYFLMQIMNGFKELHKHKIMHRDFKLANIFLNDDKVIIGDFGFAKSGADMAETKLGSPITMAPELLNATGRVRYTNKADLWSVGVCFFQMIFGNPPWKAKAMKDLQREVQTMSGRNLRIPSNPPTSSECKDLLMGMLDPNPSSRIGWQQFYNHKLFDLYQKGPTNADMRQSVMFRNHEDKVKNLFLKNKQNAEAQETELIEDPTKIKLDPASMHRERSGSAGDISRIVSMAIKRYTHEKKIVVFIMHSCRKLRNLSKRTDIFGNQICEKIMNSALLLLKKGIMLNATSIHTIEAKTNTFGISGFESFINTSNAQKILKELHKDHKLYYTLLSHLQSKLTSEFGLNNPDLRSAYEMSKSESTQMNQLEAEIQPKVSQLVAYYRQIMYNLDPAIKREVSTAFAHLYLGAHSSARFPYVDQGIVFDWRAFDNKLTQEYIDDLLSRA